MSPNSDAVPTARWMDMPNRLSAITEKVPPPMPIMLDAPPIATGMTGTSGPRGTSVVTVRVSGSRSILIATSIASTANTSASSRLWSCDASHAPATAPASRKNAQRRASPTSTESRAWCARADETEVGMMVASEVATAMCMRIAGSMPANPSAASSTGTMTMPPPMPNRPASTPATQPVRSIAVPSSTRSCIRTPAVQAPSSAAWNRRCSSMNVEMK